MRTARTPNWIPCSAIPEDPTKPFSAREVKFRPFYRVRDETYTTYFTQA